MKQQMISVLIVGTLLAGPLTVCAAGQSVDELKERATQARSKGTDVVVRVRKGAMILVGPKAFPDKFSRNESLGGKIKEMREKDFTLISGKSGQDEFAMVISYDDVLSIRHRSAFEKVLRGVGRFSLGVAGGAIVIPVYGILALLAREPEC
jgi:hypothetical protein